MKKKKRSQRLELNTFYVYFDLLHKLPRMQSTILSYYIRFETVKINRMRVPYDLTLAIFWRCLCFQMKSVEITF